MASTNDQKPADQQQTEGPAGGLSSPTPVTPDREGGGQKTSQERGAHTHHKKNPGKRPHQGGG